MHVQHTAAQRPGHTLCTVMGWMNWNKSLFGLAESFPKAWNPNSKSSSHGDQWRVMNTKKKPMRPPSHLIHIWKLCHFNLNPPASNWPYFSYALNGDKIQCTPRAVWNIIGRLCLSLAETLSGSCWIMHSQPLFSLCGVWTCGRWWQWFRLLVLCTVLLKLALWKKYEKLHLYFYPVIHRDLPSSLSFLSNPFLFSPSLPLVTFRLFPSPNHFPPSVFSAPQPPLFYKQTEKENITVCTQKGLQ